MPYNALTVGMTQQGWRSSFASFIPGDRMQAAE